MKYDYWLWESEISSDIIDNMVIKCEKNKLVQAEVNGRLNADDYNPSIRQSKVRWVNDLDIKDKIWHYVTTANAAAFGFDIISMFRLQYTTYLGEDKGYYGWHTDNTYVNDSFYDRKLSIVIQMTDPKEYEGGVFELDNGSDVVTPEGFNKKGSILVFPSFYKHRVTPVTKGIRNSLVSWVEGPHFK
jgi:PKHD-type hydroxylase